MHAAQVFLHVILAAVSHMLSFLPRVLLRVVALRFVGQSYSLFFQNSRRGLEVCLASTHAFLQLVRGAHADHVFLALATGVLS